MTRRGHPRYQFGNDRSGDREKPYGRARLEAVRSWPGQDYVVGHARKTNERDVARRAQRDWPWRGRNTEPGAHQTDDGLDAVRLLHHAGLERVTRTQRSEVAVLGTADHARRDPRL